ARRRDGRVVVAGAVPRARRARRLLDAADEGHGAQVGGRRDARRRRGHPARAQGGGREPHDRRPRASRPARRVRARPRRRAAPHARRG
ncbi:hypothetical protein BN1708_020513, partial [Verticillium longisporum]